MSKSDSVTGRDGYIITKALAYAINSIARLPEPYQEWSDMQDMRQLLTAAVGERRGTQLLEEVQLRLDQVFIGLSEDQVKGRMAQIWNLPLDDAA